MRQTNLREYLGPKGYESYLKSRVRIGLALDSLTETPGNTISCPIIFDTVKPYRVNDGTIRHQYRTMVYQYMTILYGKKLARKTGHGVCISLGSQQQFASEADKVYDDYFPTFKGMFWRKIMRLKPGQKTSTLMLYSSMKLPKSDVHALRKRYYSYISANLRNLKKAGAFKMQRTSGQLRRAPGYIRTSVTLIPPSNLKYKPFGRL